MTETAKHLVTVTRRAVFGYLAGLGGWLLVDTAEAKPKRRTGFYADVYSDSY